MEAEIYGLFRLHSQPMTASDHDHQIISSNYNNSKYYRQKLDD